ncbi:MAG TPA: protein-glutamate O-methyltransferase CheR [Rhizomicrobium sp.]|nr:protein-glutamate O-methyltransferase CheR [Rhizomicrobium sp.]
MAPEDFTFLARLVHRRAGIVLGESRRASTERRLLPVIRRFGFKDCGQLMRELRHGREALAGAVTEAMTVNETSFFRDAGLFRTLGREILPALLAARAREKRLRIWSAACAAGQEAYSIAMMLDSMGLIADGWSIDLVATDISTEAITRAERGHYNFFETQRGLSEGDLAVWFRPEQGGYAVAQHIRHMVTFRRFNLLDSFGWLDDLDLVFCRNVLIYFDGLTRQSVLERAADAMAPEGVLVLGDIENPSSLRGLFQEWPGSDGIYAKAPAPRLSAAI